LLESSIDGARGVLLSIAAGSDLLLHEVSAAASLIQESAAEDANIIWGTVIDDALADEVRVTVIAAGFDGVPQRARTIASQRPSFTPAASTPLPPPSPLTPLAPSSEPVAEPPIIRRSAETSFPAPRRPKRDDDDGIELPDFFK